MSNLIDHASLPVLDPHEALIRLFRGLPRKGPGLVSGTLKALRACQSLPPRPAVLDLGCGSGASTLILAKTLQVPITAVDACAPFLDELERRAEEEGLTRLVAPMLGDFSCLKFPEKSFDLLWSEGAISILGWEAGLQAWKPLLRSGGYMALTETVWLQEMPPEPARKAWSEWYPAMGTIEHCSTKARALGFEVVDVFPLPAEAWLDYFTPVAQRCREWAPDADPALGQVIQGMLKEVELYQAYGDTYGYAFLILRLP